MKTNLLITIALLILQFNLTAQSPCVPVAPAKQWDVRFGSSSGSEPTTCAIQLNNGGFLFGGYSNGSVSGDKTQASQGLSDYWVIKTNASGGKIWDYRFGGSASDQLTYVVQATDGGLLLAGNSSSPISGDKTQTSQGGDDFWVVKTDSNGIKLWDARYGGSGSDQLYVVKQTSDGGYILGGQSASPISGDKTQGTQGGNDFWVVKINAVGVKQWDFRYGGTGNESIQDLCQMSDGSYLLLGSSNSPVSGDVTQSPKGSYDNWLVKISSAGAKLWDVRLGGGQDEYAQSLLRISDGSLLILATSNSGISGDKTQASKGGNDLWFVKTDSVGSKIWDLTLGGSGNEGGAKQIIASSDGGYVLFGTTESPVSGDVTQSPKGSADFIMFKVSNTGSKVWDARFGGSGFNQIANGIATSDGGFGLFGDSDSPISGDKSQNSQGGSDYWFLKTGSDYAGVTLSTGSIASINCAASTVNVPYSISCSAASGNIFTAQLSDASGSFSSPVSIGTLTATGSGIITASIPAGTPNGSGYRVRVVGSNPVIIGTDNGSNITIGGVGCTCLPVSPTKLWDKRFGGNSIDDLYALTPTADSGVIAAGFSNSGISGDKTQAGQGGYDFWLVKVNSSGAKQWDKRFGGSADDHAYAVIQTSDKGYLVGGSSASGLSGDKTQASQGSTDYWVVKTDSNGNKLWDARFGGSGIDGLNSLIQTSDGGYLLGGASFSGISGDKSQASQGSSDFWIIKITSSGVKQWDKRFGGSGSERLVSVVKTSDGGYLLGGDSQSGVSGDKTETSQGGSDYWLVKTDSVGSKLWDKRYGGNGDETTIDIVTANDGGYVIAGFTSSGLSGDKTQAGWGDQDYWMVKMSSTGVKEWDYRYGGSDYDELGSLMKTSDGGYLLGGVSASNISGDKTSNAYGTGITAYWAVKTNASGLKLWDLQFGSLVGEQFALATQAVDGSYYLAGFTAAGISGDKTQGSQGSNDYWIVKAGNEYLNTTIQTGSVTASLCAGSGLSVPYTIGCAANTGNIFTAQLSDATGNFANPVSIGSVTATTSGTITANIPVGISNGSGYRIRVISSNPAVIGTDNGSNITIGGTSCPCVASPPAIQWDRRYGSSGFEDIGALVPLTDGGYILAGASNGGISGDKTQASQGGNDLWVVKTNVSGAKVFDKTYGGSGAEQFTSFCKTTDGGYLLGGYSTSGISGDKTEASRGSDDYWVVKIDSNGTKQWDKTFGGTLSDQLYEAKQTLDGGYVLVGNSYSPVSGDKTQASQGGADMWVVKINSSGIKQWDYRFGGTSVDAAYDVLQTADGSYMVLGGSQSGVSGDVTQTSRGGWDFWLVKLNSNGIKQWDRRFGGALADVGGSIIKSSDGGFVLVGYSASDVSGEKSENSRGDLDYWIVKVDSLGNKLWDATFGGSGQDDVYGGLTYPVIQTNDGNYLVSGFTSSPVSGDVTQVSKGLMDFWLVKLNSTGAKLWDMRFGGNFDDYSATVVQAPDGGYVVSGISESPVSGDVTQASKGGSDFWLIKTGSDYSNVSLTTGSISTSTCAGTVISIPYTISCPANSGNVFTAQLSDATGNFTNPVSIGTVTTTTSGTIISSIPAGTGNGSGYRIRVVSSNPAIIGADNGNNITVGGATCTCLPSTPAKQWDVRFGGSSGEDIGVAEKTNDGGFIIGGTSSSPVSGDKTQASQGGSDYWIVKTNSAGAKVWDYRYGGSGTEDLRDIEKTNDGGYILSGYSSSPVSGDKTQASKGVEDFWLVKIDSNGIKQWDVTLGGSASELFPVVRQTTDGGYIVGGQTTSPVSGDVTVASRGLSDFWVVKLNGSGVKQWDARFGGSGDEYFSSLHQTFDGGYILGGYSNSGISGDKTQSSQGANDYWVVKINSTGIKQWDYRFGGSSEDFLSSVIQTSDSGYVLSGGSSSPTSGDKTQNSQGNDDYWLVKLNNSGVKQWDYRYGGTGFDSQNFECHQCLSECTDKGFLVAGGSNSPASGDKTQNSQGGGDYWLVKVNSAGQLLWDLRYGGSSSDNPGSLILSDDGGIFISGISNSPISGDKTQGSQGSRDYWVIKAGSEYANVIVTTGSVNSSLCAGTSVNVPFSISCSAVSGNVFTAQLSNASGSFSNPVNIGTLSATTSGTINATIPAGTAFGSGYRIRVISSNPSVTSSDNGSNITIHLTTTGTITQGICQGQSYFFNGVNRTIAGVYLDTLVNANGCDSILTLNLTVNNNPTPNISPATVTFCNGGTAALTASGGASYAWSNSLGSNATVNVSPSSTTTYTITVTDANLCSATTSKTVTVNQLPTPDISPAIVAVCNGSTATLTASGGTSYAWSNSGGSNAQAAFSPTTTTTYTVTVTDGNSCSATTSRTVTVNQLPTPNITPTSVAICNGASATLTASGGTSYAWSNSGGSNAQATFSPTTTTTYSVTVTDANSCSSTTSKTITVNQLPTPNISPASVAICNGASATLTASGGTSYLWSNSGGNNAQATFSPTITTTYTVTVTDANSCSATTSRTVTVNQLPTPNISPATIAICSGATVTLTATGGTGYAWSNSGGSNAQATFSPTTTTTYIVTVTDGNSCSATASRTVTVNQLPNAAINGPTTICSGLSATLTASGGVSYSWNNSLGTTVQVTVSPSTSTTYIVTVTDANNCSATASQTVSVTTNPTATISGTLQICNGETTTLTANGGNTYQWANSLGSNASITVSPTATTTYTVTATVGANCSASASQTVIVNQPAASQFSHTICSGSSYIFNGFTRTTTGTYLDTLQTVAGCDSIVTLHLTVNPPLNGSIAQAICTGNSFTFNGQQLTQAGTYKDTIQNGNGCDSIITLNLTVNPILVGSINQTICSGSSYPFNGQQLTQAGTYNDTLQNVNGCDSIVILHLSLSTALQSSYSDSICSGDTYLFNGSNISQAGQYADTLQTLEGCDSIITLTLVVNPLPQPTITKTVDTLSTQAFTSYQWLRNGTALSGAVSQTFTLTQTGNYSVIVTDANGCTDTSTALNVTSVDVTDVASNYGVRLYPNPNNGMFILEFTDDVAREVEITDAIGRVVMPSFKVERQKQINLDESAAGIYFIHINQYEQLKSYKFSLIR